jgi:hypothetical protein
MRQGNSGMAKHGRRGTAHTSTVAGLLGLSALIVGLAAPGSGVARDRASLHASKKCRQIGYAGHVRRLGGPRRFLNLHIDRCGGRASIDLGAPCGEFTGGPLPVHRGSISYKYTASNGDGASLRARLTATKANGVISTRGWQKRCDRKGVHFSIRRSSA